MNARFRGPCPTPELITSFVDGELGHDARDVIQTHLASCPRCRADVEGERRAKRAVRSLVAVAPSPELLARLSAVSGAPDIAGQVPADLLAVRAARIERAAIADRRRALPRPVALLSGAASVAVFLLGATLFLGTTDTSTPPRTPGATSVVPAADRFAVEHAASNVVGGFGEPAALTTVTTSFVQDRGAGAP